MSLPGVFPTFAPALRYRQGGIDLNTNVLYGKAGADQGIFLQSVRVNYVPELFGPFLFADFHQAPSLVGYRAQISLDFSMLETENSPSDNSYLGLKLIHYFFKRSLQYDSANDGVYFNLASDNVLSPWRLIYPSCSFAPVPVADKQVRGVELKLEFYTRELLGTDQIGYWEHRQW